MAKFKWWLEIIQKPHTMITYTGHHWIWQTCESVQCSTVQCPLFNVYDACVCVLVRFMHSALNKWHQSIAIIGKWLLSAITSVHPVVSPLYLTLLSVVVVIAVIKPIATSTKHKTYCYTCTYGGWGGALAKCDFHLFYPAWLHRMIFFFFLPVVVQTNKSFRDFHLNWNLLNAL